MMKTTRLMVVVGLMGASCVASANTLTFETASNEPFVNSFLITPLTDDKLFILVNGGVKQYSTLGFSIDSGAFFTSKKAVGSLLITFNDNKNDDYLLKSNQTYTLTVTGARNPLFAGTTSSYTITSANGTITPVPEPESYAMLLAGLGLMGTVALRRKKST